MYLKNTMYSDVFRCIPKRLEYMYSGQTRIRKEYMYSLNTCILECIPDGDEYNVFLIYVFKCI